MQNDLIPKYVKEILGDTLHRTLIEMSGHCSPSQSPPNLNLPVLNSFSAAQMIIEVYGRIASSFPFEDHYLLLAEQLLQTLGQGSSLLAHFSALYSQVT